MDTKPDLQTTELLSPRLQKRGEREEGMIVNRLSKTEKKEKEKKIK